MLLHDKTDDQSGVGVGKGERSCGARGKRASEQEGKRTVKDDVRDRRTATTDSVEDPEIPRPRNGRVVVFIGVYV